MLCSYINFIKGCARKGNFVEAIQWLERFSSEGMEADSFAYNTVMHGFQSNGTMDQVSCRD